jgi:RNA polymerase sigma-70 factor (ECF subfamily)
MQGTSANSPQTDDLLHRAATGDCAAWNSLLKEQQGRLRQMIALRLDRRIQRRIDPSDILQEAYMWAARQLEGYLRDPRLPFYLWLRLIVEQKIALQHRQHLRAQMRDAGKEISLNAVSLSGSQSSELAARLMGRELSPSEESVRAELVTRLRESLTKLDHTDREILLLRHFEQLSNGEAAIVLGLGEAAASKRYIRALQRLKTLLVGGSGTREG